MSMMRSLDSGVSGLTNHQAILDTTANNLANVSTSGFKSSRVSFATAMFQTLGAGSSPNGQTGGTNPTQVGLGVTSASIDVDMRQGALGSTGRALDLAIQGEGFFKVTKVNPQDGTYYTRVGNFGFDKSENLVDLASGLRVNGIQDGVQGAISLTQYRSINASATKAVTFQGNLSANSASLRGTALTSVLPLTAASPDRTTFNPATESTLLKDLALFRGNATDAGLALSGVGSVPAAPAGPINLLAASTIVTGGALRTKISVPAADYSGANSMTLSVRRAGVIIGSTVIDTNLSTASDSARMFTVSTTVNVNPGDIISIVAADTLDSSDAPPDAAVGSYAFNSTMLTNLSVFGTKPDGQTYGGKLELDPWKDTVGTLVTKLNQVLTQGTNTFAAVQLENSNLTAKSLQPGDGFSLFFGEDDKLPLSAPESSSAASVALTGAGVQHPGTGTTVLVAPLLAASDGSLRPTFTMPSSNLSAQAGRSLLISVKVNGTSAGTITVPAADYTTANPKFTLQSYPKVNSTDTVTYEVSGDLDSGAAIAYDTVVGRLSEDGSGSTGYNYRGTSTANVASVTVASGGLLRPTITMPAIDTSSQVGRSIKVSVKVNGSEVGAITILPSDYTGGAIRSFNMSNLPHVQTGDIVSYDIGGTMDLGTTAPNELTWSTAMVKDSDTLSILQDRDATGAANGQVDMFEDSPSDPATTDINRWQYSASNNANFNWYRTRFSPETVSTTLDIYDSNGTKHNLEARYFKTGTKIDALTGNRTNVWDMIASIDQSEGTLNGDLVTGLQFDNQGRYVGDASLGTTSRGTGLDSDGYRGQPDNNRLEVSWKASGPASLQVDFGTTNGTDGLTGFGTASTASAVSQDGFANGTLDSMSVQSNGEIKGLYSNGQNQTIASLQVFTFRNAAGMFSAGGNLWQPSSNSGQENPRAPGQSGAGKLTSGSLEGSNVDIASEFTRLITAQRGFQVNARVITTTDQILQELAGLIR
jgi:flagellar hook protein FlgE